MDTTNNFTVPMPLSHYLPRPPKFLLPLTLYLIAFILILILVVDHFLLPAADAVRSAHTNVPGATRPATTTASAVATATGTAPRQPKEVRAIAAYSRLLLAIVLLVLFVGLLLTFRTRRFFLPKDRDRAKPTPYVDAWAESAKRMKTPAAPPDDDEPNG